jgi:hypothetical protein
VLFKLIFKNGERNMNIKIKVLKWLFALTVGIIGASSAGATGVLGTPVDGTVVSGVGVISGYHCTSKDIEVFIDGVTYGKAGAGTQLLGTQGVCGRTDTGFSLLFNFNNLTNGPHTFSVYADGVLFDTNTATTFRSGGSPWLSGKNMSYTMPNFPEAGQTATVQWVQSYQNFLITSIAGTPTGTLTNDMSDLVGIYEQIINIKSTGSTCDYYNAVNGNYMATLNVSKTGNSLGIVGYINPDACNFVLNKTSGDSVVGYELSGTTTCNYGFDSDVSVSGLKKSGGRLVGTFTKFGTGCTQVIIAK